MKKKYSIGLLVYIYIMYCLFIIFSDILTFLNFSNMLVNYFLSIFVIIFLNIILLKYFKLEKEIIIKIDFIFIFLIILVFVLRIFIPDSSFDALNYHIYLQERPFAKNVDVNFFPARWINTFSFPLCDRMHYFFRLILGYRFGMIMNLIVLIIIYFQNKKLLKLINDNINEYILSLSSFVILLTEQILFNSITYYVDILCIPFFIEIIYLLLNKKYTANNYIVLLLSGILVAMKVSNLIFIAFLAILYIIKYYRTINTKNVIIGLIIFLFPIIIYILNNYLQTGNPIFPFYNSIFKSNFLPLTNWKEAFYGPHSIIETLLWPILIIFNPRRANDLGLYFGRISIGYIASIIILILYLILRIRNKNINEQINNSFKLSIVYIVLSLLWGGFMMGYIRYALILEILSGLIAISLIIILFNMSSVMSKAMLTFILLPLILQISLALNEYLFNADHLSWRYSIVNKFGLEKGLNNYHYLFEKKEDYNKYLKNVDCFGIVDYNSGYAAMLSKGIPIISINESSINAYGKSKFNQIINKCKNIYTISTNFTIDRTTNYINMLGYEKTGKIFKFKTNFLDSDNKLMLIEIKKSENVR